MKSSLCPSDLRPYTQMCHTLSNSLLLVLLFNGLLITVNRCTEMLKVSLRDMDTWWHVQMYCLRDWGSKREECLEGLFARLTRHKLLCCCFLVPLPLCPNFDYPPPVTDKEEHRLSQLRITVSNDTNTGRGMHIFLLKKALSLVST